MSQGLCTSCGAPVNLAAGRDEINCSYCGTLVKRPAAEAQFNEIMQSKVGGAFMLADSALQSGRYKEALNYYNKAIEADPTSGEAWFRRAICIVRPDGQIGFPIKELINETIISLTTAIKFSKNPVATKKRASNCLNKAVLDILTDPEGMGGLMKSVSSSGVGYGVPPKTAEDIILNTLLLLSTALEMDPEAIDKIAKTGIAFCEAGIKCCSAGNDPVLISIRKLKGEPTNEYVASRLINELNDYVRALSKADPNYAKQVADKAEDDIKKAEKKIHDNKHGGVGCLMITCFLLLVPFGCSSIVRTLKSQGVMDTTQDPSDHIGPAIFSAIVSFVLLIVGIVSFRKYNSMFKNVDKNK